MSQKTNPTSLRLQKSNKHFESSWYSDYFYNEMTSHDLVVRSYIENIINQMNNSQSLLCIQNEYKRFIIYLFLQDARGIRSEREEAVRVPTISTQLSVTDIKKITKSIQTGSSNTTFGLANEVGADRSYPFRARAELRKVEGFYRRNTNQLVFKEDDTQFYIYTKLLEMALMQKLVTSSSMRRNTQLLSTQFLESGGYPINYVSIYPIRIIQDIQNAHFLINEIVSLLKKRVSFRQIKDQILREILNNESKKPSLYNLIPTGTALLNVKTVVSSRIIKGIRISCSGRFGGRSKKAQKRKTQSVRWGETSLHVFASKLSFASKSANTPFGKVGIKVWICFNTD